MRSGDRRDLCLHSFPAWRSLASGWGQLLSRLLALGLRSGEDYPAFETTKATQKANRLALLSWGSDSRSEGPRWRPQFDKHAFLHVDLMLGGEIERRFDVKHAEFT